MQREERVTPMTTPSTISHILAPLDGSDLAAMALPIAEDLCRQLSAELDLVSVLSPFAIPYVGADPYLPGEVYQQLMNERSRDAQAYLATAAAAARDHGIQAQTYLDLGDPASRVLDLAKQLPGAMVVMTTHGRTGLARFTLGSVADRVVRGGAAPVLLIRSFPPYAHQHQGSHALIPLDGSLPAEAPVFSVVPQLAGKMLRTLTLMQVVDPRDGEDGRHLAENYLQAVRQRLVDRLGDCDCAISTLVRSDRNPAASIVEASQDGECDLVIMATHGEAGIGRWAFGGVTDRVLRDGKTPLLLVHPPHY